MLTLGGIMDRLRPLWAWISISVGQKLWHGLCTCRQWSAATTGVIVLFIYTFHFEPAVGVTGVCFFNSSRLYRSIVELSLVTALFFFIGILEAKHLSLFSVIVFLFSFNGTLLTQCFCLRDALHFWFLISFLCGAKKSRWAWRFYSDGVNNHSLLTSHFLPVFWFLQPTTGQQNLHVLL